MAPSPPRVVPSRERLEGALDKAGPARGEERRGRDPRVDDDAERDGAKPEFMDPGAVAGRLGWRVWGATAVMCN